MYDILFENASTIFNLSADTRMLTCHDNQLNIVGFLIPCPW